MDRWTGVRSLPLVSFTLSGKPNHVHPWGNICQTASLVEVYRSETTSSREHIRKEDKLITEPRSIVRTMVKQKGCATSMRQAGSNPLRQGIIVNMGKGAERHLHISGTTFRVSTKK